MAATARDDAARKHFHAMPGNSTLDMFVLYSQDTAGVGDRRKKHPEAQQPATRLCPGHLEVTDWNRHNQEVHIKDPATAFFCPDCTTVIYRAEPSRIDEHLATHQSFPNSGPGTRADEFLNSTKKTVLKKLTLTTLIHLAKNHDLDKISGVLNRRVQILVKLPANLHQGLSLPMLSIPVIWKDKEFEGVKKDVLIEYVRVLRQTVQEHEKHLPATERLMAALAST